MKKFFALAVMLVFCSQVFAGELIIEKAKPKKKDIKNGVVQVSEISAQSDKIVSVGETQEEVLQKMGKPNAVNKRTSGEEIWMYSQAQKTIPNLGYTNQSAIMGAGGAAFNSRIASDGFGQNMYTGEAESMMPVIEAKDNYKVKNIFVKFSTDGTVNDVVIEDADI